MMIFFITFCFRLILISGGQKVKVVADLHQFKEYYASRRYRRANGIISIVIPVLK
jgi:hypothetical protein